MHSFTRSISENLHFNVTGTEHCLLQEHTAVAEGAGRLTHGFFERTAEVFATLHAAHTSTTTTGTGTAVGNPSTPLAQVSSGTAYSLYELGSGATSLTQYTAAMACTNGWSGSTTPLPTTPTASLTPQMGDVIRCTITNTKRASNATLAIVKSSATLSDPLNGTANPKAIPGAIMRYTLSVSNSGAASVDGNSVLLIDSLPPHMPWASPTATRPWPSSSTSVPIGT